MRKLTLFLFFFTLCMASIGILIIFSTSANFAQETCGDSFYFVKKQSLWLCIGVLFQIFVMKCGYHTLHKYAPYLFGIGLLFLIVVLIPGVSPEIGGARRWIRIASIGFQPSEYMKVILIVIMARYLSSASRDYTSFLQGFLVPFSLLGLVIGLVLAEKDLGTSIIIGAVISAMCFISGMRLRYLMVLCISAAPLFFLSIIRYPFRVQRIMAFLNPWADPQNTSYQVIQSMLAISSGGLIGKGFGKGLQKYYYLPEAHTDFIFSIYAEETGFIGCTLLIALFLLLLGMCIRITLRAADHFGYMLGFGLTFLLGLQVIINIGVVTSMLPTKGTPLPFISFGGSSLVMNMVIVGTLISIERYSRQKRNHV